MSTAKNSTKAEQKPMTPEDKIALLKSVHNALSNVEAKGKQNHFIIFACMNDIERLVTAIEGERKDGDVHDRT
jgi:hypothetical protein